MKSIPSFLPAFLWHFAKRYKLNILGFIFAAILFGANYSFSSYMLKVLIDRIGTIDILHNDYLTYVGLPALIYVALSFSLAPILGLYDWLTINTFPNMKIQICEEMFSYIEGHSYSYFQQSFSGSLSNKINDMARSAGVVIYDIINHFLSRFITLLIGAITMYFVSPWYAVIIVVWSVLFIITAAFLSKKAVLNSKIFSESRSTVVGKIVDSLSNVLNVKLFSREKEEDQYLKTFLEDSAYKDRARLWYLLKIKIIYTLSIGVLTSIMMALLIYQRSQGQVSVGDFALILTLTLFLTEQYYFVASLLVSFYEEVGACQQALSLISTKQEIVDEPHALPLSITKGQIDFDKVHFQYLKDQNLFTNKSITIKPGQKVGLVGFSGSGKSTFVNLILRFFDLNDGKILIDGQDIKKVTQASLRSQIAMIPQDPILFHRSVMENIRYGRLDATDEEVIEAAKKAYCHTFITKLPGGYQSLVGERGVKLSGGERQRIVIARAILKNAPVLILDEATSALDSHTEDYIQESLTYLIAERTTLIIAHRLSTLSMMDRILVFNEGKIVEDGVHEDLLKLNGHYHELWYRQVDGFIKDPKNGSRTS